MSLVFLGTSSGQPTTERNLSCVALVREGEVFLFDCGEAAQIGFRRAGLRFGRVAGVFITHLHGDHVTGLPGMLMSLQMAGRAEPLVIAGPPGIGEYVHETARMILTGFGFPLAFVELSSAGVVVDAGEWRVETAPLDHRVLAMGYRFVERDFPGRFDVEAARALGVAPGPDFGRLQRGESVVSVSGAEVEPSQVVGRARRGKVLAYCTDTRPCDGAVALASGADLLIHESTFLSDRADDADLTGHSTAAGAASVAARAGVRRLIITHFSPRYSDVTPLLLEARAVFTETRAAEELVEYEV